MARIIKSTGTGWSTGETEYTAIGDPQTVGRHSETRHPTASVTYRHETEEDDGVPDLNWSSEMLRHVPGMVTGAFAHPDMSKHIPTLLGMATNQHRRLTGSSSALPLPDSSLSVDSAAMVRDLREAGVPVPENSDNPTATPNNSYAHAMVVDKQELMQDSMYSTDAVTGRSGHTVSSEERGAGFQTAKDILRAGRRKQTNPVQFGSQGTQGTLF